MVSYKIKISGNVQGVGFRYSAKRTADALGISGWVKNEPDGSVTIKAEGDGNKVDQFIDWCNQGPAGAVVQNVKTNEVPEENHREFNIKY